MFSLFVLCLMAELIAIAAQGVRIACMLPCISEATAAQRCICNVKFCHIRFASSQTFKFKSSMAGIIGICTGAHVRLHGSSACTLLVVLLPSQRLNTAVFIMKRSRSFSIILCLFLVFALAQATWVCICALLAVHAHAHAHICYEA
jgi:hypothetical protein